MRTLHLSRRPGFTLVELKVVVGIFMWQPPEAKAGAGGRWSWRSYDDAGRLGSQQVAAGTDGNGSIHPPGILRRWG